MKPKLTSTVEDFKQWVHRKRFRSSPCEKAVELYKGLTFQQAWRKMARVGSLVHRDWVVQRLLEDGAITEEEAWAALSTYDFGVQTRIIQPSRIGFYDAEEE